MNFPNQNHKTPLRELAVKYNRSIRTMSKYAKEFGASKTREQYEQDAQTRRKTVYELRASGLKWREIAEKLNISVGNAKVLGTRYKQSLQTI